MGSISTVLLGMARPSDVFETVWEILDLPSGQRKPHPCTKHPSSLYNTHQVWKKGQPQLFRGVKRQAENTFP